MTNRVSPTEAIMFPVHREIEHLQLQRVILHVASTIVAPAPHHAILVVLRACHHHCCVVASQFPLHKANAEEEDLWLTFGNQRYKSP